MSTRLSWLALALFTLAPLSLGCDDVETVPPGKHGPCEKTGDPGCPETATLATGQSQPDFIAIDSEFIYWTNFGGIDKPGLGAVSKAPLAGGPTTILADHVQQPRGIGVDAKYVYYTANIPQGTGSIAKVPKDGGKPSNVTDATIPARITLDSSHLYFTDDGDGTVWKISLNQGGVPVQVADTQSTPFAIAVDDTGIYWTNLQNGAVMKAPLGTGDPVVLVPGSTQSAVGIAIDKDNVYWTVPAAGEVRRVGKDGSNPGVLASNAPVGEIAVDEGFIYVNDYNSGGVVKIDKMTGVLQTLFPPGGKQNPVGIAVDATNVYFANSNSGTIVKIVK